MVPTTLLYHPFMKPPEAWIKSVILYTDLVSSIVPDASVPSEEARILADYGAYEPEMIAHAWADEEPRGLVDEAVAVAEQVQADAVGLPPMEDFFARGKLPPRLVKELTDRGFVGPPEDRGMAVDRRVLAAVLSICADYVALDRSDGEHDVVTSTDLPAALRHAREPVTGGEARPIPAVVLAGLPVGAPDAHLRDVLEFRRRHAGDIAAMRSEVRRIAQQAAERASSGAPTEDLQRVAVEDSVTRLFDWVRNRRTPLALIGGSVAIVSAVQTIHHAASQAATSTSLRDLLVKTAPSAVPEALAVTVGIVQARRTRAAAGPLRVLAKAQRRGLIDADLRFTCS